MKRLLLALAALLAFPLSTAAQPGKTSVTWYGQSAFVVRTPKGTVLAIDPWLSNPLAKDPGAAAKLERVDFILISHGHADHVGDAIAIAQRTHARFVGPYELASLLKAAGYPMDSQMMATSGNMGGTFQLTDEIAVSLVPALHSSGFQKDAQSPAQYGGNPVGFVIKIQGGPTLYHTGDTDLFGDMRLIPERFGPVDVMLACIGGHFTMDPVGAAEAARWIAPKAIVPMHFGTFPLLSGTSAQLERALRAQGARAKMIEMKVGETRTF